MKTNYCFPRPNEAMWLLMAKEEKDKGEKEETRERLTAAEPLFKSIHVQQ